MTLVFKQQILISEIINALAVATGLFAEVITKRLLAGNMKFFMQSQDLVLFLTSKSLALQRELLCTTV